MSQIATTLEQSKRLLDAGLSPETADMYYRALAFEKDEQGRWFPQRGTPLALQIGEAKERDVPAWSLSKLISMVGMMFYRTPEELMEHLVSFLCETMKQGISPYKIKSRTDNRV